MRPYSETPSPSLDCVSSVPIIATYRGDLVAAARNDRKEADLGPNGRNTDREDWA